MPNRPAHIITLAHPDRIILESWARRRKTAQALSLRARIILACAEPAATNSGVARALGVSRPTVQTWRQRFAQHGPDGLLDQPRPGAPRRITDVDVERVITTTLEAEPTGAATHWSTRSLARATGMSQSAVSRIWRAFALQPHRCETFKLSRDPLFIDKVRDIVGLYLNPPDRALVLCVDEKPQIPARSPTAPILPMRPGQVERHTHDYVRHGTTDLFAALDICSGRVVGECRARHTAEDFRAFLDTIDRTVPDDLEVHVILDNAATHKTPLIHRWLAQRPRYHLHFTPTSASWLNMVEGWFALLTRRQLRRGAFRSTQALEAAIRRYIEISNTDPKPFVWTKTADDILDSIKRFCQRTSNQATRSCLTASAAPSSMVGWAGSGRRQRRLAMRRDDLRDAEDLASSGHASGPDAPLRATAAALERARHARSVVLVEGISDQIAVETLASLQGRDLTGEGVVVVPIGGAHSVGRFLDLFGPVGRELRISGLCDAAEEPHLCRALARAGYAQPATRSDLEREGFFVCDRDLEDELIRAVGPEGLEALLAEQDDLGSFRTLQKQATWRNAPFVDQVRRFLGAGARRKLRYAGLLVRALDIGRQPRPLRDLLRRA